MAVLGCHVKGRQAVFVNGVDVGTVRVQKRDGTSVAVLRSAVHGCAAQRVGSGHISAAFDQKEHDFVVAVLRGSLQRSDAVVLYPYLVWVFAGVEQLRYLQAREGTPALNASLFGSLTSSLRPFEAASTKGDLRVGGGGGGAAEVPAFDGGRLPLGFIGKMLKNVHGSGAE